MFVQLENVSENVLPLYDDCNFQTISCECKLFFISAIEPILLKTTFWTYWLYHPIFNIPYLETKQDCCGQPITSQDFVYAFLMYCNCYKIFVSLIRKSFFCHLICISIIFSMTKTWIYFEANYKYILRKKKILKLKINIFNVFLWDCLEINFMGKINLTQSMNRHLHIVWKFYLSWAKVSFGCCDRHLESDKCLYIPKLIKIYIA